jgi:hypothetical protein
VSFHSQNLADSTTPELVRLSRRLTSSATDDDQASETGETRVSGLGALGSPLAPVGAQQAWVFDKTTAVTFMQGIERRLGKTTGDSQ